MLECFKLCPITPWCVPFKMLMQHVNQILLKLRPSRCSHQQKQASQQRRSQTWKAHRAQQKHLARSRELATDYSGNYARILAASLVSTGTKPQNPLPPDSQNSIYRQQMISTWQGHPNFTVVGVFCSEGTWLVRPVCALSVHLSAQPGLSSSLDAAVLELRRWTGVQTAYGT